MSLDPELLDPPATPALPARVTFAGLYAIACKVLRPRRGKLGGQAWDVEDIIHDTAIVAHRQIDRYVPPLDCTDPERALGAWLHGIAWRLDSKYRQRWQRRPAPPVENGAQASDPEALARKAEREKVLAGVLHELRPERAEVLIWHVPEDRSVPEIARMLGLNENTVRSRIQRGLCDARGAMKRRRMTVTHLLPEG